MDQIELTPEPCLSCATEVNVNAPLWLTLNVAGIVIAFAVGALFLALTVAVRRSVPRWATTVVSINGVLVLASGALVAVGYWDEWGACDPELHGPTVQVWRHAAPYPQMFGLAGLFVVAGLIMRDDRLRAITKAVSFGVIAIAASTIRGDYGLQAFAFPYGLLAVVFAVEGWKISLQRPRHDLPPTEPAPASEEPPPRR